MKKIVLSTLVAMASHIGYSQNVGIGESNPASKGSVKGNLSVGNNYSTTAAPANGAIIEGNVGIGTNAPNAKLDITSTTSGVLIPRMTLADRNTNLTSPPTGLLIYQTDNTPGFYYYNGSTWVRISESTNGIQSVGVVAPLQSTGGQNPTLSIPQANSTTNGFLSSADWAIFNNKLGTSLSNGRVWIGDGSNVAQPTAITGDATLSNTGVLTLANSGVTAGAYGSATTVPIVTVDAKGRITGVTTTTISGVAPGGAAGGDLTGNYPNPTIAAGAVNGGLSGDIADNTITVDDIATDGVGAAEIAASAVGTSEIANGTVANVDLANMAALSVKGNATNAAAAPTDIAAASDNQVLRRSGTAIGFGSVNLASSSAVTGTLPIANGGTNSSTALSNNRVIVSSSGAIVESAALTANSPLYTNASGLPTTTAPTSGAIGYWTRATTTLSPTTANDIVNVPVDRTASFGITGNNAATAAATGDRGGMAGLFSLSGASANGYLGFNSNTGFPDDVAQTKPVTAGVYGIYNGTSANRYAIFGEVENTDATSSTNKIAIYGRSNNSSGNRIGVVGDAMNSSAGNSRAGVLGLSGTNAITISTNISGTSAAVMGISEGGDFSLYGYSPTSTAVNPLFAVASDIGGAKTNKFRVNADGQITTSLTTAGFVKTTAVGVLSSAAQVALGSEVTGTLPVANGGTGAGAFTQGSVVFAGASGVYAQNNANFFWNNTDLRLGIGTASPNASLHVVAPSTTAPSLTWNAASGQILRNENAELAIGLSNASPFPFYMQARTNSNLSKDLSINPLGGNVGIGTTSPVYRLDVEGDVEFGNGTSNLEFIKSGTTFLIQHHDPGMAWNNIALCPSGGNVGIGTASPGERLEVSGKIRASQDVISTNGYFRSGTRTDFVLALQSDRNMVLYDGAAVWSSGSGVSDIRTKTNIRKLESVLPILTKLSAIRFQYKPELDLGNEEHIGVIAQEIKEHFPNFVYYDEKSDRYLVYYDKLTTVLLKGLQEQQQMIDALTQDNVKLKSVVSAKAEVSDIEKLKTEIQYLKDTLLKASK